MPVSTTIVPDDLTIVAQSIAIDLRANTLAIAAAMPESWSAIAAFVPQAMATMDIGTRGRLLSLECEPVRAVDGGPHFTITIAEPEPRDLALMRSVRVPVAIAIDRDAARLTVTLARNGADYDLAWPSGNQCWRRTTLGADGQPTVTCAVLV